MAVLDLSNVQSDTPQMLTALIVLLTAALLFGAWKMRNQP